MNLNNSENDITLFNCLFADYQAKFFRFAFSYTNDRMAAEDIVMESMMYYWENRQRLNQDTNPPAYILTSIKNKCLNYLRDSHQRQFLSEQLYEHEQWKLSLQMATLDATNPSELFSKEMQELVNNALKQLPETTRRIFIMRRFEEKSFREIAEEMNMSVKGVEYHMAKATESLKKSLKDFLPILFYLLYRVNF